MQNLEPQDLNEVDLQISNLRLSMNQTERDIKSLIGKKTKAEINGDPEIASLNDKYKTQQKVMLTLKKARQDNGH